MLTQIKTKPFWHNIVTQNIRMNDYYVYIRPSIKPIHFRETWMESLASQLRDQTV